MLENRLIEAADLQPFPTSKEELAHFKAVAGDLFDLQWLESAQTHRLQRLWARQDELARLELASLGHAIQALSQHDKWLRDAARNIRRQPEGGHGHIFEVMMLGGLAAAGSKVEPMPARAAGYDAQITLPDGHVVRASIKNHDLSSHEAAFRMGCDQLDAVVRARVADSGGAWSVMAGSVTAMSKRTLQALMDQMRATPLSGPGRHYRLLAGEAALQFAPLLFPGTAPPSYQMVVRSPAHPKEQANFRNKLVKAIEAFSKHSPLGDGHSNVVFMRVHATADVDALRELARELLMEPGCVVDAVYFTQNAVAREDKGSVVSYYMPVVRTERFTQKQIKLQVMQLGGRQVHRPTSLQLQSTLGLLADISGQYMYQRGHLYYPLSISGGEVKLNSPGPGIQTSAVIHDGAGGQAAVFVRRPDDEELLVL